MESPLALYRRYRPETFQEVIGQDHVTEPLRAALAANRVNHAYLFSGPRGCGKTTSARILARALNCAQAPIADPCGECDSCRELARTGPGSMDVIEIDAASHGGVDDARDLREKAFFAPVRDRYKVYIIDEAHMVTTQGFNALLKLVEEPPPHLRFIFATTEPDKVLPTIRSRTHHYPFRLIPPRLLSDYLSQLAGEEGVTIEPAALPLVVRAGAGSARDTLSVLDQLLGGAGPAGVTHKLATDLLGFTKDVDVQPVEGVRVVQLTPPGSGCSRPSPHATARRCSPWSTRWSRPARTRGASPRTCCADCGTSSSSPPCPTPRRPVSSTSRRTRGSGSSPKPRASARSSSAALPTSLPPA